jgi:hypothetical protein
MGCTVMNDFERELERLRRDLADQEPIQLRNSYLAQSGASRPVWQGTTVPVIGFREFRAAESGLVVPANTAGPAPIDAISVFLTGVNVFQQPITADQVLQALRSTTAADFLFMSAYWLAPLEAKGTSDTELQLQAAANFFEDTPGAPILTRVRNLITSGSRLLAPQILMSVMKAALLEAPKGPPSDNIQGFRPLVIVMLGLAQALGAEAKGGPEWGGSGFPEKLAL